LSDTWVELEKDGVRSRESDGVFVLSPPGTNGRKNICYIGIVVKYGFAEFDRLAAYRGDPEGQYRYRRTLQSSEAVRYLKLAADQNHAEAQFAYAVCLSEGVSGVQVDLIEAAKYYKLSADQGHIEAIALCCFFAS
jgi:TPR repeat protein